MRVWYRFFPSQDSYQLQTILAQLEQAGIQALPLNPSSSKPGLVIFQTIDENLQSFLHAIKQGGIPYVLAIGLCHSAVDGPSAWKLLRAGASDVLTWDQPALSAKAIAARLTRKEQIYDLVQSPVVRNMLVGRSATTMTILQRLVETAYFTDVTVLLMGESGTGKELAAQLIHTLDQREGKGELVILDCSTIVPELSGSEFFGHERGAFTGAITARDGAFALANKGTLFLDEIGELPLNLQGQLLRAIQERSYKRVGGNTWHRTNFRLICATNRNLLQDVNQGRFRSDLYYRIAGELVTMPPLRERSDDILPLAEYFLAQMGSSKPPPTLDEPVKEHLLLRGYPGNIRDLKQLIMRIMSRHVEEGPVTVGDLPEEERHSMNGESRPWCDAAFEHSIRKAVTLGVGLKDIGRTAENLAVTIAVTSEQGNLQRAAAKLKVTDRALQLRRATNARWFPEGQSDAAG